MNFHERQAQDRRLRAEREEDARREAEAQQAKRDADALDAMASVPLIFNDPRLIKAIWFEGETTGGWEVGAVNVTKILAYRENGSMDHVPWFAVYVGDHLKVRVPAHMVTVVYQDPTP